jgi:pimeloyl-ACP methyl ester carboxylesterase
MIAIKGSAFLAAVGLCAALAAPPSVASPVAPADSNYQPRFVPGPCPKSPPDLANARCGHLVVPEDRAGPGGPKIYLQVAIVPAVKPAPGALPLVFLDGGPGNDAILDSPLLVHSGLNKDRPLILMSQRGTHSSTPALTCPVIDKWFEQSVTRPLLSKTDRSLYAASVRNCHEHLVDNGVDLAAFNSTQSAADLADLRKALDIREWDVMGHSYGSYLALIYMRDYPQGIHSVVLDGVVPPAVASPGWTWTGLKESLDAILAACRAQRACRARYPNTGATITYLMKKLTKRPITTRVRIPSVDHPLKVELDGGALVNWLVGASHRAKDLPMEINELAHGDPKPIATQWAAARADPAASGVVAHGLSYSVWCSEWVPYQSAANQLAEAERLFPSWPRSVLKEAPQLTFLREACKIWDVPKAPASVRAPTRSSIPTLLMSGSFDAQSGAEWAGYAARTLSDSTSVTLDGVAHGTFATSCGQAVIQSFLDTGRADTSCVASVKPPPFTIGPRHK